MTDASRPPRSYLVLHHIVKSRNLGALLRSAEAFGVHEVIVVGRRQLPPAPSCGMQRFVKRVSVPRLADAEAYLRERNVTILGVEIDSESRPIDAHPFAGDTAFVLGNEGDGLTVNQRAMCDRFVRIRQHGHAHSLNVNVAGAIVLHHFSLWAGFLETPIQGQKYIASDAQRKIAARDGFSAD